MLTDLKFDRFLTYVIRFIFQNYTRKGKISVPKDIRYFLYNSSEEPLQAEIISYEIRVDPSVM